MHPICYATVSHAILAVESQLEARISAGVSTPAHETPTSSATLISVPPITTIPVLNLTPDGTPLTYPLAITGPDAEAWLLADCAELRKLFLTLQCIVPTMNPISKPTYFKRVVKEKWDHVLNKIKSPAAEPVIDHHHVFRTSSGSSVNGFVRQTVCPKLLFDAESDS